jgi:hypothetical protein
LLFYIILILVLYQKVLSGDETRHVGYAQNLLHGYYSNPGMDLSLEVGPGYPLFIFFFLALHIPLIFDNLMNEVFVYLAVVLLFKALEQFVSFRSALICGLFLACYCNAYEYMALLYSESFTLFLVSLIIFLVTKSFIPGNLKSKENIFFAGVSLGILALTKIIFGYVIVCVLAGTAVLWLLNKKSINYRKSFFILLISLITTIPYLIYTYHLTNRLLYWGTSGGTNLYWMSTPYEGEYGNWIFIPQFPSANTKVVTQNETLNTLNIETRNNYIPGSEDSIKTHHEKDFEEIYKYTGVKRDDAYKKYVLANITSHPLKYIENCVSNIGRMFFNYPYSYTYQKPGTLLRLPFNGIIAVLMLFCIIPTLLNWRRLNFAIHFILFIVLFYLGGSIFGSAETRMFTVIVPMLLFWIAYILQNSVKVKLEFGDK